MSPWMSTEDIAEYLRYTGTARLRSVYRFIKRKGLVPVRDGRRVLVARADVERALTHGRQRNHVPLTRGTNSLGEARS